LKIKRLGRPKKHLGIWWEWRKDHFNETYLVATMPKMVEEISAAYEAAKKKQDLHRHLDFLGKH
jgi:hypothetical protein